ncbi:MAG: serine hydrolase [Clostridia bacterium]|nr:serine hydrolase [Clostridia bacterium]
MKTNTINKLFILIIILFFLFTFSINIYATDTINQTNSEYNLNLYSNNTILMDADSGAILYNKGAYTKIYPASTTKILTAIIAIEKLDLNSSVVASKEAIYTVPAGSSHVALKIGEVMSVEDLLYCLILNSGNDAANVLAEAVSGNIPDFIKLMNESAKELGCTDTNFTSAHGFHDDNHYTTPYDMLKILKYAIKNETFRKLCETKKYVVNETNKTNEKRYLKTTDKLLFTASEDSASAYYEYALGGKTGYTEEAKGTFVGYAKKGDSMLLVGTFDGEQNIAGGQARFIDSITLFKFGFDTFNKSLLLDKDNNKFKIVDKNNNKIYTLALKDSVYTLADKYNYSTNYSLNINFDKLNLITNKYDKKTDTYDISNVSENNYANITYSTDSRNWNLKNTSELYLDKVETYKKTNKVLEIFLNIMKYLLIILPILFIIFILLIYIKKSKNRKGKKITAEKYLKLQGNVRRKNKSKINKFNKFV